MRLHLGPPPATPDFTPFEDGWTPLKEPGPLVVSLIAFPIGIVTGVLVALGWGVQNTDVTLGSSAFEGLGPLTVLMSVVSIFGVGILALIAVHEFVHALAYPKFGFTPSTIISFWPSKLLFLAMTHDALRRNRLLLVYILPLLVISVLPLIVCRSLGIESPYLAIASIFNGLAAGGDIFCFCLILFQVPANAVVRNQGWATWWKRSD